MKQDDRKVEWGANIYLYESDAAEILLAKLAAARPGDTIKCTAEQMEAYQEIIEVSCVNLPRKAEYQPERIK